MRWLWSPWNFFVAFFMTAFSLDSTFMHREIALLLLLPLLKLLFSFGGDWQRTLIFWVYNSYSFWWIFLIFNAIAIGHFRVPKALTWPLGACQWKWQPVLLHQIIPSSSPSLKTSEMSAIFCFHKQNNSASSPGLLG